MGKKTSIRYRVLRLSILSVVVVVVTLLIANAIMISRLTTTAIAIRQTALPLLIVKCSAVISIISDLMFNPLSKARIFLMKHLRWKSEKRN